MNQAPPKKPTVRFGRKDDMWDLMDKMHKNANYSSKRPQIYSHIKELRPGSQRVRVFDVVRYKTLVLS